MSSQRPSSPPAPPRDRPWFEVRCWWEPPVAHQGLDQTEATPRWITVTYCEDQTIAYAIADALLRQPWHYYRRAEVWGPGQPDQVGPDGLMRYRRLEAPSSTPATVGGHWRARFRVILLEHGEELHRTYSAWIGASSREEAQELLRARLEVQGGGWTDLRRWELDELVNAARDQPEVIAMWRED